MTHRTAPRLPYSSPAWLTPSRIAIASIAAFAASAALPAIWWIRHARGEIGNDTDAIRAVAAVTSILSLLLALRALRAESVSKAVLWSIAGGILAGVLNAGISCGVVHFIHHRDPDGAFANLLAGLFFGGFYGGPLGILFGLAHSIVIASASRAHHTPSHDGPDRTLLTAGLWLTLAGLGLRALIDAAPTPVPPELLIALGVPSAALAIARIQARKRWLAKITRGLIPAFRIEELPDPSAIPAHLIPLFRSKQSKSKAILSYLLPERGSPYRDLAPSIPLALTEPAPPLTDPTSPSKSKSPRRPPRAERSAIALELQSVATDIFIALAKTMSISLILLIFVAAVAAPFFACAAAILAPVNAE